MLRGHRVGRERIDQADETVVLTCRRCRATAHLRMIRSGGNLRWHLPEGWEW